VELNRTAAAAESRPSPLLMEGEKGGKKGEEEEIDRVLQIRGAEVKKTPAFPLP
jgi:hypothetical protein